MMKEFFAFACCLLLATTMFAQGLMRREVVHVGRHDWTPETILPQGRKTPAGIFHGKIPFERKGPFIAWAMVWQLSGQHSELHQIVITFEGLSGSETLPVVPDPHADAHSGRLISELSFLEYDYTHFTIHTENTDALDHLEIHFIDPGHTPDLCIPSAIPFRSTCVCPLPAYINRAGWCPDGSCPPHPNPSFTNVTHLIVHHSAGTNVSNDWGAVVRSIWDFHVHVNGWSDIGYNWLIAPNGIIYEGRGDNVLGAHFCGKNSGTMGVCLLGNYTTLVPQVSALKTLTELLAWKCCDRNLIPTDSAFHNSSGLLLQRIAGHRDGCATTCPGDAFYPMLPWIRLGVKRYIDNDCAFVPLEAPTHLVVQSVTSHQVGLKWEDNSEFEAGFILERSVGLNNNYTVLATLPANTVSYSDQTVAPSGSYFYRVKAFDAISSSAYSNEVSAMTDVADVSGIFPENVVRIFPNPAQEYFTLTIENQFFGKVSILLFDQLGRQVMSPFTLEKYSERFSWGTTTANLPSGIYQLYLIQGQLTQRFRLWKS